MIAIIVLWILLSIIAVIVILLHFSVSAYVKADSRGFEVKIKYMFFTIYPVNAKKKKRRRKAKKIKKEKLQQDLFEDNIDGDFADNDITEASLSEPEALESILKKDDACEENTDTHIYEEKIDREDKFGLDGLAESLKEAEDEDKNSDEPVMPKKKSVPERDPDSDKNKKSRTKDGFFAGLKEKYELIKPYIPMGWKYFKKLCKTIRFTDTGINITVGREDAHEAAIFYGALQGALFNFLGLLAGIFTVKIKRANVNCVFTKNTISGEAETTVKIRPSALIALAVCIGVNFLIIYLKQKRKLKIDSKNENTASERHGAQTAANV